MHHLNPVGQLRPTRIIFLFPFSGTILNEVAIVIPNMLNKLQMDNPCSEDGFNQYHC